MQRPRDQIFYTMKLGYFGEAEDASKRQLQLNHARTTDVSCPQLVVMPRRRGACSFLAKTVSWRITGTVDTFVISAVITSKITVAGSIAATELFTKIAPYYFHERIWATIPWGHRI
jgi:uncharacterized membrane protein